MLAVRTIVLVALFGLSACGDDSDAPAMWDTANDELHRIHGVAFANGIQPAMVSTYDCLAGGSVEMTLDYDGAPSMDTLNSLLHTFEGCKVDKTVINGQLDYTNLSSCDNGTFSFDIDGMLSLTGEFEADCQFTGTERCGKVVATVCGDTVR